MVKGDWQGKKRGMRWGIDRERKANEKAEAARLRAEEIERQRREEAERAEAALARAAEEAAEQKKIRQREKKAMQKERQLLRKTCADICTPTALSRYAALVSISLFFP
jgi:hypothetical protein